MTKLLINEHPLMVLPSLAMSIGLNEAMLLQQVHYWLDSRINNNFREGKHWVYNTYKQWNEQFPFWSEKTIKRIISSLEKKGLLLSFIENSFSKLKWYTIDYTKLSEIENDGIKNNTPNSGSGQNDPTIGTTCPSRRDKVTRRYNIKNTETTTKTTHSLSQENITNKNHAKENLSNAETKEREMLNIWNDVLEEGATQITVLRANNLRQISSKYFENSMQQWQQFCVDIKSSDFLMGKITNFKISIDWILKEDNLIKVLEGNYGVKKTVIDVEKADIGIVDLDEPTEAKEIRNNLLKILGQAKYNSWFKKIKISIYDKQVNFKLPNKFVKSYIIDNYVNLLEGLVAKILGEASKINLYS